MFTSGNAQHINCNTRLLFPQQMMAKVTANRQKVRVRRFSLSRKTVCISIYLPIYLPTHLSFCPPACLPTQPPIYYGAKHKLLSFIIYVQICYARLNIDRVLSSMVTLIPSLKKITFFHLPATLIFPKCILHHHTQKPSECCSLYYSTIPSLEVCDNG
jgi:hypothetical protein